MSVAEAFGDIANVIAKLAPDKIIRLSSSKSMQERVNELVQKKRMLKLMLMK